MYPPRASNEPSSANIGFQPPPEYRLPAQRPRISHDHQQIQPGYRPRSVPRRSDRRQNRIAHMQEKTQRENRPAPQNITVTPPPLLANRICCSTSVKNCHTVNLDEMKLPAQIRSGGERLLTRKRFFFSTKGGRAD